MATEIPSYGGRWDGPLGARVKRQNSADTNAPSGVIVEQLPGRKFHWQLSAGVPQQVSLQGVQTRQRLCNDLSLGVRIRVWDEILDSREHRSFRLIDSKAKFYGIVFNEGVGVKSVPFGLIHMAPQVLNVRHENVPKGRKSDYTVYPVWLALPAFTWASNIFKGR